MLIGVFTHTSQIQYTVDENVIVGSVPSSAGKTSILDYGTVDEMAQKLLSRR